MKKMWKVGGNPTIEFIHLSRMSSRDAIIYIANKYKEDILLKGFLSKNDDYSKIATDFGISNSDLFMYTTYRLKVNELINQFDEWRYYTSSDSKTEKKKLEKQKEKDLNIQLFYSPKNIWKILAYYCKFYSYKKVKAVLKEIQHLHYSHKAKGWKPIIKKRLQEIFTPMFFPHDGYKFAHIMMCKITKKEKKGVYKGILNEKPTEDIIFKLNDHYNPECLVITKNVETLNIIDNILKKKRFPIVIGVRENPRRNIINNPLEIKETKV